MPSQHREIVWKVFIKYVCHIFLLLSNYNIHSGLGGFLPNDINTRKKDSLARIRYLTVQIKSRPQSSLSKRVFEITFLWTKAGNDLGGKKTPLCPFSTHIHLLWAKVFPANHTYFIFIQLSRHLNLKKNPIVKYLVNTMKVPLLVQFLFHDSPPFI